MSNKGITSDVAMTTPDRSTLKTLFKPFDTRFNKENFDLHIPDNMCFIFRHASVLIPLFYKDGEIHVLLTVRTKHLTSHSGQVAFPGGMSHPGDLDVIATALRETEEEIGIHPENVDIVATLPPYVIDPNFLVTPVLGIISSDIKLNVNPQEVDTVFDLPLKRFLSEDSRTQKIFTSNGMDFNLYHFYEAVNGQTVDIWGFASLISIQTAIVTYQSNLEICFYKDIIVKKTNCFTVVSTQEIVNKLISQAKL